MAHASDDSFSESQAPAREEGAVARFVLDRVTEVFGILVGAIAVLMGLALVSLQYRTELAPEEQWVGPFGYSIAQAALCGFGVVAWLLPVELALLARRIFRGVTQPMGPGRLASAFTFVFLGCALLELCDSERRLTLGVHIGGAVGELLGSFLSSIFGFLGAALVTMTALLVAFVLRTSFSIVAFAELVQELARECWTRAQTAARDMWIAFREAREIEKREEEAQRLAAAPKIVCEPPTLNDAASAESLPADTRKKPKARAKVVATNEDDELAAAEIDDQPVLDDDDSEEELVAAPVKSEATRAKRIAKEEGPRVMAPVALKTPPISTLENPARDTGAKKSKNAFVLPPTTLLDAVPTAALDIDEAYLRDNAIRLVSKLEAYGVRGRVDEIHPGPVVTMYEFEPESGTKVSKIASLSDDLAMALAAQKVRIVAPIPGKARVGFELPNKIRQTVSLREILEDSRWNDPKPALPVALGKDIAGHPVYGDLARMPHLLVAGATGAGKSVGLNVMLASLLMKRTPEEVRMLMIDPKVVELAVFDGIPHMLLPVVTDMKKASLALRWAVDEMERRYQLFADAGARNITTYNERVEKVLAGELAKEKLTPKKAGTVRARGAEGEDIYLPPEDGEGADELPDPTKLPYIVVVVDEFADLMMVAAKDVESAIARLAQKARAAGIHVILATQRPSVDVITGMIKANFPARIAFKVSQREDSKTILGRIGAEHLLGNGDMLMIPPGASDLKRVHSAYISEGEVMAICDHLRAQGTPVYDQKILEARDEDGEGEDGAPGVSSDDPLYDRAVGAVAQAGYCSISHIQRQLGIGYNKAAKLVERMEKEGIVGSASAKAGGRREVLVQAM